MVSYGNIRGGKRLLTQILNMRVSVMQEKQTNLSTKSLNDLMVLVFILVNGILILRIIQHPQVSTEKQSVKFTRKRGVQ